MMWIIGFAGLAIAGVVGVPFLMRLYGKQQLAQEMNAAQNLAPAMSDPLLTQVDSSRPVLLYFTAAWCGACRTTQTPILEQLLATSDDDIQLVTIDVEAQPEAAERWHVKILPRTFVLRSDLTVHTANVGVVSIQTLREQIAAAQTTSSEVTHRVHYEEDTQSSGFKISFRRPDAPHQTNEKSAM